MTQQPTHTRYAVVLASEIADAQTLCDFVGRDAFDQAKSKHDRIAQQIIDAAPDAQMLAQSQLGFVASFKRAGDAVNAALKFQHALRTESWSGQPVAVRIGIHQGEISKEGDRWVGRSVDIAHCMMQMAMGGQLLLTHTVADDAQPHVQRHPRIDASLTPEIKWMSHGRYTLGGGAGRIEVFEVGAVEFAPLMAPGNSAYAQRLGNGGESVAAALGHTGSSIGAAHQPAVRGVTPSRPPTPSPAAPPAGHQPVYPLNRAADADMGRDIPIDHAGGSVSGATGSENTLPTIARLGAGATSYNDASPSPLPAGMSPGGAGTFGQPAKEDDATAPGPPSEWGDEATIQRPLRDAAPTPGAIGRLGDYELLEQIGAGGMGRVFKARHIHMGKLYAVKVLQDNLASNPRFVGQFRHEARVMAELRHDHIAVAHPLSQDGDTYFLAMEYLCGPSGKPTTLQEEMEAQPLKRFHEARVLRWATQIAGALEYAHNRRVSAEVDHHGVVHRDIKPANILLDDQGNAKLTDFGLAKLVGTSVTGKRGTPGYMAPEQCDPEGVIDERTDIYAFGAMIYKMLTGRRPDSHVMPPTQATPGIDPRWDAVILKCMQPKPADRYQNIADMLVDLTQMAHGKPARRLPLMPAMMAVAAAALVLAVGVSGWMVFGNNEDPADPADDGNTATTTTTTNNTNTNNNGQTNAGTNTASITNPPRAAPSIKLKLEALDAGRQPRTVLYDGEKLLVRMETDKACHLTLFHVDAQGEVILLLPNSIELDTRASANTPRIVPKQGGREGLNFDVGRPYGTMRLVALATHRPVEVETVDAGTFVHAAVAYLPRGKQTMLTLTDDDGLRRKVTLENAAAGLEPDLGAASQIEVEVRAR